MFRREILRLRFTGLEFETDLRAMPRMRFQSSLVRAHAFAFRALF